MPTKKEYYNKGKKEGELKAISELRDLLRRLMKPKYLHGALHFCVDINMEKGSNVRVANALFGETFTKEVYKQYKLGEIYEKKEESK